MKEVVLQTGGVVWKLLVQTGDKIKEGDTLFILEVMKMEVPYFSPISGTVAAIHIDEGELVKEDQLAIEISM